MTDDMAGRPRKTTLQQRLYVIRVAKGWSGSKRTMYNYLVTELKVCRRTIQSIIHG